MRYFLTILLFLTCSVSFGQNTIPTLGQGTATSRSLFNGLVQASVAIKTGTDTTAAKTVWSLFLYPDYLDSTESPIDTGTMIVQGGYFFYYDGAAWQQVALAQYNVSLSQLADTADSIKNWSLLKFLTFGDTSTFLVTYAYLNSQGYATTVAVHDTAVTLQGWVNTLLLNYAFSYAVGDTAAATRYNLNVNIADTAAAIWSRMLAQNYLIAAVVSVKPGYGMSVSGTSTVTVTADTTKLIPFIDTGFDIVTRSFMYNKGYITSAVTNIVAGTNIWSYGVSGIYTVTGSGNPTDSSILMISTSTSPSMPSAGHLVMYANNMGGRDEIHIVPSVGNEYRLQPSFAEKQISRVEMYHSGLYEDGVFSSNFTNITTTASVQKAYDAVNALPNYNYLKQTTASTANISAAWYENTFTESVLTGNAAYCAGGDLVITFGFPTYLSTQRVFVGIWAGSGGVPTASADPSALTNTVGVGKDAGDTALSIYFNGSSGTATKVFTGVKPNANNVYRVGAYLPPNTTTTYVCLEVITKTSITSYTTFNSAKAPAAGTAMQPYLWVNTGSVASAIAIGLIKFYLEEY